MRLLVVEDDRLLNNTLCYNLTAAGYEVDAALTQSAAEQFCRKQEYDLIVLDVNLPEKTVTIEYREDKTSPEILKKAIGKLGYTAMPMQRKTEGKEAGSGRK